MCGSSVCSAQRGQKRAADPLKLEAQMIVGSPAGAGNETLTVFKSNKFI